MERRHPSQVPQVFRLECIASSNDVVLRLADDGAAEHTTVVAREQIRARGGGRPFHAPLGGLWMSTLWRPQTDVCNASLLTLAAAWGVREGVRRATGVSAGLKWPNDLLLDGRKLGGVLVEGRVDGPDVVSCAVGVGLNVNNPPEELPGVRPDEAVSLARVLGGDLDLRDLQTYVAAGLREARRLLREPDEVVRRFSACWTQRGQQVAVDTGIDLVEGEAIRIDAGGGLVVGGLLGERRLDDPVLAKFVRVV